MNLYRAFRDNPVNFIDPFGLYDFSEEETQAYLDQATKDTTTINQYFNFWMLIFNHRGGGTYDFKQNQPVDRFCVNGKWLRADEFGNYIAGYASTRSFGVYGYAAARIAGSFFGVFDDKPWTVDRILFGGDDWGSVYRLTQGAADQAIDPIVDGIEALFK